MVVVGQAIRLNRSRGRCFMAGHERAIRTLAKSGFDMWTLSIVGRDCPAALRLARPIGQQAGIPGRA